MIIAANLATPVRGERSHLADVNARHRVRAREQRYERSFFPSGAAPAAEASLVNRVRARIAEERWQSLDVCALDEAGQVALEQRRWMQMNGIAPLDLYVMIEGHEPPTHLTPDDLFALIVCAYLTVRRRAS